MSEIKNCQIRSTMLGVEDHGIFTFMIHLSGDGWSCGYGGYSLDEYDKKLECRLMTAKGAGAMAEVLRVLEVDSWEKLPGTFIRCESEGLGRGITRIGHLLKDQWLDLKKYFNDGDRP